MSKVIRERLNQPSVVLALLVVLMGTPVGWRALIGSVGSSDRADAWPRPADPSVDLPIEIGATWRYFKGIASAPPAAWTSAGFDDSTWLTGASGIGYGDGDDATVLADMQNAYTSIYIRKDFTIPSPAAISGLRLTIDYDDAYVVYLNGAEFTRSASMGGTPGVPPAFNALSASGHEASGGGSNPQPPDVLTIPAAALVQGTNALGIQVHNQTIGSSDLSILPALAVQNAPPSAPAAATPAHGATGVSTSPTLCVDVSDPEGGALDVTFHGREATGVAGDDFTLIALPDTQYYAASFPATFSAQTAWIRDNRVARSIAMVMTLGDCTDNGGLQAQWDNADAAFSILENPLTTGLTDGIPYGVAVGNHDQSPNGLARQSADENITTNLYNLNFPKSRFSGRAYHGGQYPLPGFADSMDNHYELWSAGGMDFISFHLEWDNSGCSWPADGSEPPAPLSTCQSVLKWMRDALTGPHAGRRALVATHFMGTPSSGGTGTLSLSAQGQAIVNAAKGVPNVFLLLGGHLDQADRRTDLANDGHVMTTLVSDYQTRPNGGNGWLRILTFSPQNDTIRVETWSPVLGRYINKLADGTPNSHADNLAPTENEITLSYEMDSGEPFAALGTDTGVPSGQQACVTWPGRQTSTPYEWYAVVTDGVSTTVGARQTFTTTTTCGGAGECDDADPCTIDTCSASNLCEHEAIAGCCETAADCDDANVCTDDSCTGNVCGYVNNTGACSDGSACTVGDACGGGACIGGAPLTCDDANACTADACLPESGCAHALTEPPGCCTTNAHCDDGLPATLDVCTGGSCSHQVNPTCGLDADCNDNNVCTADTCSGGGYSLQLNGSTQYVTMGQAPGLGSADFTLEAWIKWNGATTGATASSGTNGIVAVPVIAKGRGEADGNNLDLNYFFGIDANSRLAADFESLEAAVGGNNNYPARSTQAVTANVWHHVAVTYDAPPGTGCWDIYLDGVAVTDPAGRCPNFTPRHDSLQHFGLGTAMNSSGTTEGRFAGRIDEARVWTVARTQAEIQAGLSQVIATGTNLAGHWGFDDGSTATDSAAPPAENGTLAGAPVFDAADKPSLGAGQCQYTTLSCDDGNVCTADVCDPQTGCAHPAANDGSGCDDTNACTSFDVCSGGACAGIPNGVCCNFDTDCDDDNACTADQCLEPNGAALQFDGVNDSVDLGTSATLTNLGTGSFTVEGWMYTDGAASDLTSLFRWGRQQAFPQVVVQLSGGPAPFRNLRASVETVAASTQVDTAVTCSPTPCPASTLVPINTWTHFALVADRTPGAQRLRLYLNGDLAGLADATVWGTNAISTTDAITLGATRLGDGTLGLFYDGRLDEVRFWSTARTEAEIESTMNQQLQSAPGLLARWGLNEGSGGVTEESVAGTSATINGATWSTTALVDFGDGLCESTPLTGTTCDDGNACTTGDTCQSGACTAGGPESCDDSNGCTDDACDDEFGCVHTNNTASCSDGNACTTGDVCSDGACGGGTLISCDDADACTTDACSPATGCTHTAVVCDDGDPCTADTCSGGSCVSSPSATVCSDGVSCTTDVCGAGAAQNALQFNGSGTTPQFVGMGAQTARLGLARFTVEAWVKWDGGGTVTNTGTGGFATSGTGSTGGALPIVTKGRGEADGTNVDANYFLGLKGGVLVADFEEGIGGTALGLNHPVCGSTVLDTAGWHHVAATYDGTCWQLYVDGNPETLSTTCSSCLQTGACNICPGQPPRADSIQHFGIGSALSSTGAPEGDFQGRIDEVRVWSYARSAAEVATTRDKRLTQSLGLVGRWGLDEGAAGSAADSSGGGANGTLTNAPAWVTGSPALTTALCTSTTTASCCLQAADCNDANACTADACDAGTHTCGNVPVVGSCDDGNACTSGDVCTAGVCAGTGIPNCCSTDAQCDDGSSCTTDVCNTHNVAALQFDGTNDYVTMGSVPGATGLGLQQFTLEGWIKWTGGGATTSTGNGGLDTVIPLITKGRGEADGTIVDANYFFGIAGGRLAADYEQKNAITAPLPPSPAGQNRPICGTINVPVGTWAHVAVTYDGTWRLYVNGTEGTAANGTACASTCTASICSASPGATPGVIPRDDSTQHFGLGTAMTSTGVAAGFFAGQMDEVRVWNRALSAAELAAGMNRQVTSGTGLVGRWDLNQNTGTVATDSAGTAQPGTLRPGPSPDLPVWVTVGIPNFGDDTCGHLPTNNGGACNDGSVCTTGEVCSAGACGGGSPVSCDDNNACTVDACDALGGCSHTPVVCNDGDACTTDSCNPLDGQCVYAPLVCDDGDACNGVETCSAGACVPGTPVTCTPLDQCHVAGVCDPETGVCSNPNAPDGTTCNDGNACTATDVCGAGTCAGTAVTCDDGNVCNGVETCSPSSGCQPGTPLVCDDGLFCNGLETCAEPTGCQPGTPPVCEDGNPCTADACDEDADACTYAPTDCDAEVSGTIRYYRDADLAAEPSNKPVGGVTVGLTGTGPSVPDSVITAAPGQFSFPGRLTGQAYTVSPSKSGDFIGAVSSFDAALVARASVGLLTLTPHQTLAGDASGNGGLSSFDASNIAQLAAGLITRLPAGTNVSGDWFMVPTPAAEPFQATVQPNPSTGVNGSVAFSPLVEDATGQDFLTGLFGDVSGNWSSLAPVTGGRLGVEAVQALGLSRPAVPGQLVVSQAVGLPGRTFEVTIAAQGTEDALSFDLDLGFDASNLTPVEVRVGDAARAFTLTPNLKDPGHVRISLFGPQPLGASGDLVVVTFRMANGARKGSTLTLAGYADEGSLAVSMKSGKVRLGKNRPDGRDAN